MSRIAVCISGQLRTFRECYRSLYDNVLAPFSPDVFVHTWTNIGMQTKTEGLFREKGVTFADDIVEIGELEGLYSPVSIVVEDFESGYYEKKDGVVVPEVLRLEEPNAYKGAIPMFYKLHQCNELKKEQERKSAGQYDWVVRIRPDMKFHRLLEPGKLIDRNKIWLSDHMLDPNIQASDKFAIGPSDLMDYYSGVWTRLTEYWKNPMGSGGWNTHRVGERLMKYHLDLSGMNYEHMNFHCELYRKEAIRLNNCVVGI